MTTPLKDSHFWSSPKICTPKLKHIGSFGNLRWRIDQEKDQESKICILSIFVLDILSKLNSRSRDMGYHTHTFSRVVYGFKIISISISKLSFSWTYLFWKYDFRETSFWEKHFIENQVFIKRIFTKYFTLIVVWHMLILYDFSRPKYLTQDPKTKIQNFPGL